MWLYGDGTKEAQPPSLLSGEEEDVVEFMALSDSVIKYGGDVNFDSGIRPSSAGNDADVVDKYCEVVDDVDAICNAGSSRMSPVVKKRKSTTNNGIDRKL